MEGRLTYTQATTAWRREVWCHDEMVYDELNLAHEHEDGGVMELGELTVEFLMLGNHCADRSHARLCAFAGKAYRLAALVLPLVADAEQTPEGYISALRLAGFVASEYHGQLERDRQAWEQ